MPLMRIDMPKGRSAEEVRRIVDVAYEVARETLGIPEGDRYQVVTQHEEGEMILGDTGLGFERPGRYVLIQVTSRPRTVDQKKAFYSRLAERLDKEADVDPRDLMVNFVIVGDADWSFAYGRAQFLDGELRTADWIAEGAAGTAVS